MLKIELSDRPQLGGPTRRLLKQGEDAAYDLRIISFGAIGPAALDPGKIPAHQP